VECARATEGTRSVPIWLRRLKISFALVPSACRSRACSTPWHEVVSPTYSLAAFGRSGPRAVLDETLPRSRM